MHTLQMGGNWTHFKGEWFFLPRPEGSAAFQSAWLVCHLLSSDRHAKPGIKWHATNQSVSLGSSFCVFFCFVIHEAGDQSLPGGAWEG